MYIWLLMILGCSKEQDVSVMQRNEQGVGVVVSCNSQTVTDIATLQDALRCTEIRGRLTIEMGADDPGITDLYFLNLETVTSVEVVNSPHLRTLSFYFLKEVGEYIHLTDLPQLIHFETPAMTEVESVRVVGTGLYDFSGVQGVSTMGGEVVFRNNPNLEELGGLHALSWAGGNVVVENNPQLVRLHGLESLSEVYGKLSIVNNPLLESVSELSSLEYSIAGLEISANPRLSTLQGLEHVDLVRGDLIIEANERLRSLEAFRNLWELGGSLVIRANPRLKHLNAFDDLHEIHGDLILDDNDQLRDLASLTQLTDIWEALVIQENASLNSITTLFSLSSIQGLWVTVMNNPKLFESQAWVIVYSVNPSVHPWICGNKVPAVRGPVLASPSCGSNPRLVATHLLEEMTVYQP